MNKVLFSVVMPSFNSEKYIKRSIESVLNQSYENWELIIVDNNSSDNTLKIAESFNDDRIKVILIDNQGVIARSRNKGLEVAKGEYTCFLDSDDLWGSSRLEIIVESLKKNTLQNAFYHSFYKIDKDDKKLEFYETSEDINYFFLLKKNVIGTLAACVKTEILKNLKGFNEDPDLVGMEDWDLWLRIIRDNKFTFLKEENLAYYRVHGESYSSNMDKMKRAYIKINDLHFSKNGISEREKKILKLYAVYNFNLLTKSFSLSEMLTVLLLSLKSLEFNLTRDIFKFLLVSSIRK